MRLLDPIGDVRLRLAALGDIGVIGAARERARREGFDAAFAGLAPHLGAADLGFANLEFPVGDAGEVRPGRSSEFRHDPETIAALGRAGVGVVSVANNHILDCGPFALERTLACCAAAGLHAIGAGADLEAARRPACLTVAGARVVILAYAEGRDHAAGPASPGVAPLDADLLRQDLNRWRDQADLLVVSAHWGSMYVDYPPPRVIEIARELAGLADLVLGHHPHVTQGFRRDARTLTLFSMGDAVFNSRAGDVQATVAAERRLESGVFTVLAAEEPGLEYAPLTLDHEGFPREPDAQAAASQVRRLRLLSEGLDHAGERFASESASTLMRYELESLATYLRQGRLDRVAKLLGGIRPRHLPVLWHALKRMGRPA